MPVIRIDDEVWKELQKRAEPLVDTPNTVLRKLLDLNKEAQRYKAEDRISARAIEIRISSVEASRRYALFHIPKQYRRFFPGYKIPFYLETDIGTFRPCITSAPKGTPPGAKRKMDVQTIGKIRI